MNPLAAQALKKAQEIGTWLYGPDDGMSEGLVRTLIDKIAVALLEFAAETESMNEVLREQNLDMNEELKTAWITANAEADYADEMKKERDALREALKKYGGHLKTCSWKFNNNSCNCGLRDLLNPHKGGV